MSEPSTENLATLIEKRLRCLTGLRNLSTEQSTLIAAGNMTALMRSFTAKNQWIVALQAIERELAPFHDQEPEARVWTSAEARQKCAAQAAQCKAVLEEVMTLERENERSMTQRRDKVATQLQSAHAAGTARSAYQSHQKSHRPSGLPATHLTQESSPTARLDLNSEVR